MKCGGGLSKFVYIGTKSSKGIAIHNGYFFSEKEISQYLSKTSVNRPETIPKIAEREGTFFVNRTEYLCLNVKEGYTWWEYGRQSQQLYWNAILTPPCLTSKEQVSLLALPHKFLNPLGKWMKFNIRHEKDLRRTLVEIKKFRIRIIGR